MFRISLIESFLLQTFLYALIWYFNEYVGSLLSILIPPIAFALLCISYITERIEKSKVPSSYFRHMWLVVFVPLLVGAAFTLVYKGNFDWLQQ